jgi:hypothetical protein
LFLDLFINVFGVSWVHHQFYVIRLVLYIWCY